VNNNASLLDFSTFNVHFPSNVVWTSLLNNDKRNTSKVLSSYVILVRFVLSRVQQSVQRLKQQVNVYEVVQGITDVPQ
jgi:hypothetical protein